MFPASEEKFIQQSEISMFQLISEIELDIFLITFSMLYMILQNEYYQQSSADIHENIINEKIMMELFPLTLYA